MGDVVPIQPRLENRQRDTRRAEASLLRKVIEEGRVTFAPGEGERVAAKVDDLIDRQASALGRRGVTVICERIWPGHGNPAQRRRDLRSIKKPTKLIEYVRRIAQASGASEDDMLLEAFRDTRFERDVAAHLRGTGSEPDLEAFWVTLSGTLQALAGLIMRAEKLEGYLESLATLNGSYDLATGAFRRSSRHLLNGPLANWNEHCEEFPPIPSVVLFTEPKSVTVERHLAVRDTGQVVPVRMAVLREVRLAVGPADNVLVPAPLFEFRSVLHLAGPGGPLQIRRPWLYLDEDEVEVEIDGAWQAADIPFDGGNPDGMPEGYDPELLAAGYRHWKFPAALEAPLQFEHSYIVWRPITAGTCRELLLRPCEEVALGLLIPEPPGRRPDTFCPPGTLAEAVETALHVDGPEGLAGRLRAEAARVSALVRAWHTERAGAAEAAHRDLRAKWEKWS